RTLEVVAGIGALISCAIVFLVTAESDVAVLLAALLVYWVGVALITVVRLWSAGRGQPTVARKRTRLMSLATAALIVALLLEVFPQGGPSWLHILANTVTLVSALAFGLGLQPPLPVRLWWNQP